MFGPLGGDKYREYCRDIHESGHYLLDVINDILDMSKIEAGRIQLDFERFELGRFLADTHARRRAARRRQAARAQLPTSTPASACAPTSACSSRSCSTSCPTRSSSRPKAAASRCARAASTASSRIAIDDTGIGIPRGALAKLGRPFEQVESQLTKSHQGSGLGLAIAKSLTELHGGTMRIRSTPGRRHAGAAAAAGGPRSPGFLRRAGRSASGRLRMREFRAAAL